MLAGSVTAISDATRQSNTAALDRRTALAKTGFVLAWQTAPVSPYSLMVGWQRSCSVDTHVRLDHQH